MNVWMVECYDVDVTITATMTTFDDNSLFCKNIITFLNGYWNKPAWNVNY